MATTDALGSRWPGAAQRASAVLNVAVGQWARCRALHDVPFSDIWEDSRRVGGGVSHLEFVASALATSADHLNALRVLGPDFAEHPFACYSLLRASFEASANALWTLAPPDWKVRLSRWVDLEFTNLSDFRTAVNELPDEEARRGFHVKIEERWVALEGAVSRHALAVSPLRPWVKVDGKKQRRASANAADIVRAGSRLVMAAGNEAERSMPELVLQMWRGASGFAHGRSWAQRFHGTLDVPYSVETRQPMVLVGFDWNVFADMTGTALRMSDLAFKSFDRRNQPPDRALVDSRQ